MALKDCLKKMEKAGIPVSPAQVRALEAAIAEGLTDDQAVRRASLMAHQKVIDIVGRARDEGAEVVPFANPVSKLETFQSKALEKVAARKTEIKETMAEKVDRLTDVTAIEGHVRTRRTPSGKALGMDDALNTVWVDLTNDDQVLDALLQMSFSIAQDKRELMGLMGNGANEMLASFKAMQEEKQSIKDEILALEKELIDLDRQVDGIFSGVKQQSFDQTDLPRLTVVHNLSGDNLTFANDMGGLPMPSLALMPEGKVIQNMGEISLIGTEDLGDPAKVPVHDADAYTVTYPRPDYKKPKKAKAEALTNELRVHAIVVESFNNSNVTDYGYRMSVDLTWEYLYNGANPDKAIDQMMRSNGAKSWFLAEQFGETAKATIVDVEPRHALSWSKPMLAFFKTDTTAERDLAWDDPKRKAVYKRAGDAYKKAVTQNYKAMYGKRGVDNDLIDELIADEIEKNLNEEGGLVLSLYDQMERDQKKRGKQKVSDLKTGEKLDAMLKGREAKFQQWVSDKVMGVFDEPRIKLNGKWEPYNLENITRKMKSQPLVGAEDTLTFGEGAARAAAATRITSLQEARNRAEWQIESDEKISLARDHAKVLLENWRTEVIDYYGGQTYEGRIDTWNALDASMRALAGMVNSQMRLGAMPAMKAALRREDFGNVPDAILEQGVKAAEAWMSAPVPYFEAKPRRAVKLEEFAGAVIPSDASADTRAILLKHRIPFKVYQKGTSVDSRESRAAAVAELTETLNNKGERTLFQSDIGFTSGLLTAARVMPREKGPAQEMLQTLKKQPNVKEQELEAVGVYEWADAMGEFTRDQLIAFVEQGGVQVKETFYAGESIMRTPINFLEERAPDAAHLEMDDFEYDTPYADFQEEIFDLRDNDDPLGENFRVWIDKDAGNVSVQVQETEEWLEVPGSTNNQEMFHAKQAIEKYIYDKREVPGAAGPARWTQWTLPAPDRGPFGDYGAPINHREIVLHVPTVGGYNYKLEDLHETTYQSGQTRDLTVGGVLAMSEREYEDRQNELFWYIEASSPLLPNQPSRPEERDRRRIQTFQIKKSDFKTMDDAKRYIMEQKPVDPPVGANFGSHAFSEQNIIAWMRVNDRFGPNGEQILFVEETQSDLHQAGLSDGYNYTMEQLERAQAEFEKIEVQAAKMLQNLDEPFLGYDNGREALNGYWIREGWEAPATSPVFHNPFDSLTKKQTTLMRKYLDVRKKTEMIEQGGPTPNMPFKGDAWAELAMKRIIRMAVEGGYDQVAWTNAEQQLERYDIDEHFSKITWDPRDEMLVTYDNDDRMIDSSHKTQNDLEELFGAERLLEMNRSIDEKRSRWAISPVYLSSKQLKDMSAEEIAAADAVGEQNLTVLSPNEHTLDDIDQFIGTYERGWLEENGVAFALMDENGELVRQGGGDYQMWETFSGADEGLDDFAFAELPELTNIDIVDEEGKGLRRRYDELMVNVTNRALRKLDKSVKVKRLGVQMEGGGTVQGQRIEREGGGNLVPGTVDPGAFYVSAWTNDNEADKYDRKQISPRFDTYEEAEAWHDNITLGFGRVQHGFDLTDKLREAAKEGQTYFQDKHRGQINFDEEGAAIIRLAQSKNLSTFLHESAHLYLEMMADLVEVTHADPGLIDDFTKILNYLGVKNRYEIETRHHELFARSFEAYLREGVAPTAALQPIFSAYSGWLLQIYDIIRKLLRPHEKLNDEIRGVFDRMVASDQAISDTEDMLAYVQLYATAEEMGVSQEVFDVYKKDMQAEHDAEVDKLTRKSLKAVKWAKEQWWKTELKKVKADVRAEAEQEPVYMALAMLQRGKNPDGSDPITSPIKLDKKDLISRYGKDFIKRLPGRGKNLVYSVKGGTDADIAANIFGFEDGDALINAMIDAPKMDQFIKDRADQLMKELHPDPLNDPEILEETVKQVHTTGRSKILAKELRALRKQQAEDKAIVKATKDEAKRTDKEALAANKGQLPKRENMPQIKAAAAEAIAKKRIRDINPRAYQLAERKAGRLAFQAMERKDYAAAYEYKLSQIMNFEAYRAALKAKTQATRDHKYLLTFNKKSKASKMGKAGYLERIQAILEGIDMRKISMERIDREKLENELMEAIKSGDIVTTPEVRDMLDNPGGVNWKDMTFKQFAGIRDVVKQLEHQARTDLEVIINGEKQVIQEKVDEVAGSIIENNDQVPQILTSEPGGGIKAGFRDATAHWLRSSSIARVLDKSGFGAVTRNVIVPIRRAVTEKLLPWQHKASEDVAAIYKKHYNNKQLSGLGKKLAGKIMGQSWAKSDILALALHWGTEGGRSAVLNGVLEDAYGNRSAAFTQEGVAEAFTHMDARDWAFVQDIWDYQESYWEQLKETEQRRRGIAPEKVESFAFEILSSDGETVHLRGGYHHLQYMNDEGQMNEQEFTDYYNKMSKGSFLSASTRAGATYNRTEKHGKVIHLTLNTIDQNLREILRDMAMGDEVNLVNRILNSDEVRRAAKNTNNIELLRELKLWLSDAAVGELPAQSSWEKTISWFRVGFTKSKLAFNVYVTLLQLTGAFQSMATIGSAQYMRGLGQFLKDPVGNWKMVSEQSTFMNARYGVMQAFDKDVADTKAFLQSFFGGVPTQFARSMDTAAHYYFMPIAKFQQFVDTTTWMAAYDQAINDPKIKSKEEARYYADAQVERAQTSGLFSDRSGLERGTLGTRTRQGQFVRLWTVLISYMLAKGNIAYEKGKITEFKDPKQAIGFAVDMVLLFAVEGMASALLYGDWPEDEDGDGEKDILSWGATATIESLASGIPMVREYSGAKYGSGTTPIGALTVDLWKTMEQLGQFEADEAAVKSTVKAAGTMFHLPASQVNRAVEAFFKEGDTDLHEWFMGVDEEE